MSDTSYHITEAIRVLRVKAVCGIYDQLSLTVAENIMVNETHDIDSEESVFLFDYVIACTIHLHAIQTAMKENPFDPESHRD
jgi:hypothetical protein